MAVSTAPSVRPSAARQAVFEALHEPRYRQLWLVGLCVNVARWMDFLVLGWLVLELTSSPLLLGVAAFCRTAPMMVLGLFAGLIADRFHRGRIMILVQTLNLAATLALALLFATGQGGFVPLIVMQTLLGAAWAIDFPSRRTVLYQLVGPGRLTNAISLESVSMQGTKMAGPILGGLLLGRIGPAGCYLILALFFLAALLLLMSLNRRVALRGGGAGGSMLGSLASGFREVRAQPVILAVLAITVIMNMLVFPYQQMLPVFARDILFVGPELLGLLVAADGLGALLGALYFASRRGFTAHRQVFAGGSLLAAILLIAFSFSPWYLLSLPLQFMLGMAESCFGTMQGTIVLLSAPERARGRIMGMLSVCIGIGPIGALWMGLAASELGVPTAVALSAALAVILMLPLARRLFAPSSRPVGVPS